MTINEQTTAKQAPVIGIFRDRTLAQQALDELHHTGWSNDQAYMIGQQNGGLLTSLKSAFSDSSNSTLNDPAFQGLSDEQRAQYQHAFEQGHSVVAVYTDNHPLEVRDTLHRFGAMNVMLPSSQGVERVIPLRREDVAVQKNNAVIGELRIHKRIITENRTFTVPITREEVTIERFPVSPRTDQQASVQTREGNFNQTSSDQTLPPPAGLSHTEETPAIGSSTPINQQKLQSVGNSTPANQQQSIDMATLHEVLENGGSLKILVHEEQVIIQKQTVVVEEILLHKQAVEETRNLSVPVRHEEAFIERHGNFQVHGELGDGTVETDTATHSR